MFIHALEPATSKETIELECMYVQPKANFRTYILDEPRVSEVEIFPVV